MYLITPTLLNSFNFYREYDGEDEAKARNEFLSLLRRERIEPTEAMQAGIDFENKVLAYCNGSPATGVVQEIGDICKGGMWQVALKKHLDNFLLYGKADVMKEDTILDIKRTSSYDIGKYQSSLQHRIYMFCSGFPKASYLISDGKSWWREDYYNHKDIEEEIRGAIYDFTAYLKSDDEARGIFDLNWQAMGGSK